MAGADMILVADIGGTNTRLALGDRDGKLHNIRALQNADIRDLREPLAVTMAAASVTDAVFAVAGPVDGDVVSVTNYPWKISKPDLKQALGLRSVTLINDFLAAAHAIPAIEESELQYIRRRERGRGNLLVCGPGTGFGAAALIDSVRGPVGVASEAGHAVLGAANDVEETIFRHLRKGVAPLSVETVLSGAGLSRLHEALTGNSLRSEEIFNLADAKDHSANDTIAKFLSVFGRVAGDLALAYSAAGGVFIAGGVGRALAKRYEGSPFLASFDDHPPYSDRLSKIPIALLLLEQPGLLGALRYGLSHTA